MKMPTTVGATIDALYTLREQKKELEAQIKGITEKYSALESHLMTNFDRAGLEGAKGRLATASLKHSTQAEVTDWDAFYKWISKTKSWECLQKRPGITALRERWDAGKQVPGVEPKAVTTLSLTGAK